MMALPLLISQAAGEDIQRLARDASRLVLAAQDHADLPEWMVEHVEQLELALISLHNSAVNAAPDTAGRRPRRHLHAVPDPAA